MKKIKLKRFSNKAKALVRSSQDDVGYDLYSAENKEVKAFGCELILM